MRGRQLRLATAAASSGWACQRRSLSSFDPSQLVSSPGGLMALLYGRTSVSAPSAPTPRAGRQSRRRHGSRACQRRQTQHRSQGTEEQQNSGGGTGPAAPSGGLAYARAMLRSDAVLLAALIFLLTMLWELAKSQQTAVYEKVKHFFFCTLEVRSSQAEFAMLMDWMARQPQGRQSRNLSLRPVSIADEEENETFDGKSSATANCSELVPGYGKHIFSFRGTRMWVSRELDQSKKGGSFAQSLDRENDVLTITFFSRDRSVIEDFLEDVRTSWNNNVRNRVQILGPDYSGWRRLTERTRRPLETLYLAPDVEDIVQDAKTFMELRSTYSRLGIPWRRGYLFEGPPGTGKSSFVLALAGELNLPICVLTMQGTALNDEKFFQRMSTLPSRCIVLMEDFENAIKPVTQAAHGGTQDGDSGEESGHGCLSLSALLNAMDGVSSGEGRLLIMTSNDLSKIPIPDALLRPGRIDRRVHFPKLSSSESSKMQEAFRSALAASSDEVLREAANSLARTSAEEDISPAAYQQRLLKDVFKAWGGGKSAASEQL